MSMSGANPAERTEVYADFMMRHAGKAMTNFGSFFSAAGDRIDGSFCASSHESTFKANTGSNPTMEYTKMLDWFETHKGHALTHMGAAASDKGSADVWYCQKDNKVCFDNKT